ncbi:MAG: PDDEXK nuclease domain-containing protein [Candidatus Kapabacteria bacterium]|nr:PDDEXK nuclease domain-containing protein [Candidatus Kapabacteria bacterium]
MSKVITENKIFNEISEIISQARITTSRAVNTVMTLTYFEIGRVIVENEQEGSERAKYASKTLANLSEKLTDNFGKGFSVDNLQNMRKFFLLFKDRIYETPSSKFITSKKSISETPSSILKGKVPFQLSWSHYVLLLRIEDNNERNFYEIESANQNWSIRELKRQFNSALYERILLSNDKKTLIQLGKKGQIITKAEDLIKDPYILEFLNLEESIKYSESDLENLIIDNIEKFILELGKGFLFSGRQVRFTFDEEHFYVDLVFYNRILKCFVLIDLKIGKLKHQDLGQMQMYVNYYDRYVKNDDENKTIGILLCKDKNKSMVEITLPKDNEQIFTSKYQLYLPSKDDLKNQLEKAMEEA